MTTPDVAVIASLVGIALGALGATLGVMNYLRDRSRVIVTLQWDWTIVGRPELEGWERWGLVTLPNIGRRPIFVSHVALLSPKGVPGRLLFLPEGIQPRTPNEADPPVRVLIDQKGLREYAPFWRDIRAQVRDSSNRVWKSKKSPKDSVPSWATLQTAETSSP